MSGDKTMKINFEEFLEFGMQRLSYNGVGSTDEYDTRVSFLAGVVPQPFAIVSAFVPPIK